MRPWGNSCSLRSKGATALCVGIALAWCACGRGAERSTTTGDAPVEVALVLPPTADNPRNSEGDFVRLADGRLLFVYTHFYGGPSDHAPARLAARESIDGGRTWSSDDRVIVDNESGMNVMSASLVRLPDESVALFYLQKHSLTDTRPVMRISRDETKTWSEPSPLRSPLSPASIERLPQTGELLAVWNDHYDPEHRGGGARTPLTAAISRDDGRTWSAPRTLFDDPEGWYCYTAIHSEGDDVLLGHCAGGTGQGGAGLNVAQITRVPIAWLGE